jgi:shikimate kinase
VAYLRVSYAEALARVGADGYRPMLARPDITGVYERRQASYAQVATVTVTVDGRSPGDIAADILGRLGG